MRQILHRRVRRAVRELQPGYFALVMATGIVSVGLHLHGFVVLSVLLLVVCTAAFVALVGLTGWRLACWRDAVVDDVTDPARAFAFFTFVAGANVLGVRLALDGYHLLTAALLVVAGLTWLVLGYAIPWTAVLGTTRRPVVAAADGTWFVWVVAGQSVAIAAATLEPVFAGGRDVLALVAVLAWSVGVVLYAAVGVVVAARMLLYALRPRDLTPPYWVAMGAAAITVVAGARIVQMADTPMVTAVRDLVAGTSVVFWAFATWLVPALVAAGWWRHRTHRVPLTYDATAWSIVFPLGMYAVAGIYLGRADRLPLVGVIGGAGLWVAFTAWVLAFAAMAVHLVRTFGARQPASGHGGRRDGSGR